MLWRRSPDASSFVMYSMYSLTACSLDGGLGKLINSTIVGRNPEEALRCLNRPLNSALNSALNSELSGVEFSMIFDSRL